MQRSSDINWLLLVKSDSLEICLWF